MAQVPRWLKFPVAQVPRWLKFTVAQSVVVQVPKVRNPCTVPQGLGCVASRDPWGQIIRPIFKFRWFWAPLTNTSYTKPQYYPKYEIQVIEMFMVEDPLRKMNCLNGSSTKKTSCRP